MPYDDDNPQPLRIVEGELLTPQDVRGNKYQFQVLPFSGMGMISLDPSLDLMQLDLERPLNQAKVRQLFPPEMGSAIAFRTLGALAPDGMLADEATGAVVALSKKDYFRPSGFFTTTDSVMPAMVLPNGMSRNSLEIDGNVPRASQVTLSDFAFHARNLGDYGLQLNAEQQKYASQWEAYGAEVLAVNDRTGASYITSGEYVPAIDKAYEADTDAATGETTVSLVTNCVRNYRCALPDCGAIAILADIIGAVAGSSKPYLQFDFAGTGSALSPPDWMRVRLNLGGQAEMTVCSEENTATGPITFSDEGVKSPISQHESLKHKGNLLILYPTLNKVVLTGDLKDRQSGGVVCVKSGSASIVKACNPRLEDFPRKHKAGEADSIVLDNRSLYYRLGGFCNVTVHNCRANFGFSAVRFSPVLDFTYLYRVSGDCRKTNLTTLSGGADDGRTNSDYFCLEVGGSSELYRGWDGRSKSRFLFYDSDSGTSLFAVHFRISARSGERALQLYPIELLALIHVSKSSGKLADVRNNDGDFAAGFAENVDGARLQTYMSGFSSDADEIGDRWSDYITELSVTHTKGGSTGTATLDSYMMSPALTRALRQSIGAVTLAARNGYYAIHQEKATGFAKTPPYEMPDGLLFKGYAVSESQSASESSNSVSIQLEGIQRKLSDMVLVNCPYWDGDQVFRDGADGVLNYFVAYTGCRLVYDRRLSEGTVSDEHATDGAAKHFVLPQSLTPQNPSVHYAMGTPVLQALNDIAGKVEHQFVIQPDGKGYFYGQNKNGLACWIKNGPVRKVYAESEIVSLSLQPYLADRFNTFFDLALGGKVDANHQIVPDGTRPLYELTELGQSSDDYPWSRLITHRMEGIVNRSKLLRFHRAQVRRGRMLLFTGKMTVQGTERFFLLDKIAIDDENGNVTPFYITEISHALSLSEKSWTTSLSISTIPDL